MSNPPLPNLMHMMLLVNRVALAGYLLVAGQLMVVPELTHGLGTFYHSDDFAMWNAPWLPEVAAMVYGYALPWLHIGLGGLLLAGLLGRLCAAGVMVMMLGLSLALLGAGQTVSGQAALVFFTLAATLAVFGPGRYSLDMMFAAWRRVAARQAKGRIAPSGA